MQARFVKSYHVKAAFGIISPYLYETAETLVCWYNFKNS